MADPRRRAPARRPDGAATQAAKDEQDVEERSAPATPVVYEVVRRNGEEEMARPSSSLWWSGVAAGLSISFSLLAQAVLEVRLPEAQWKPLLVSLGFPVGFLIVVLGRQQLFTESTITMVLPVLAAPSRRCFAALGRTWSIILAANLAGTLAAALFCSLTPVLAEEVLGAMRSLAHHALAKPAAVLFFEGITAGFLMAAMVWLLPAAGAAQFHVIVLITYVIAISGAAHVVTGSLEAFLLVVGGSAGAAEAARFALPVLAGNIAGGTGLFAVISYAQVKREL